MIRHDEGFRVSWLFAVIAMLFILLVLLAVVANAATPCGPKGDSPNAKIQALDVLKNRIPHDASSQSFAPEITLAAMQTPGNDTTRFKPNQAAVIHGYVALIKDGGPETANCHGRDELHKDTHIELCATAAEANDKRRHVIVEITPAFKATHPDWTTAALKKRFQHKTVVVTGWLFFDAEHKENATNTNPKGSDIWRATCWELHPVTTITEFSQ